MPSDYVGTDVTTDFKRRLNTSCIAHDRNAKRLMKITPYDVSSWHLHVWETDRWVFVDSIGDRAAVSILYLEQNDIFELIYDSRQP